MAIEFVGSQIAQSAAGVSSYTISTSGLTGGIDTQVRAGDTVVIAHGYSAGGQAAPTITDATGLAFAGPTAVYANDTVDTNMVVRWAKASTTPAATITVSKVSSTANSAGTVMFVFRGVDTLDTMIQQATGIDSNTPDPPISLSATDAGCAAVVFGFGAYSNGAGYTITAGPATSTGLHALQEGGAATYDLAAAGAYKLNIGTGPLNPGAFTVSGTAVTNSWAAATVILRPTNASASLVANAGRKNLVLSPNMAGAEVGVLGAGGAVPTGWDYYAPNGLSITVDGTGQLANGEYYIDLRLSGTNDSGSAVYPLVRFNDFTLYARQNEYFTQRSGVQLLGGSMTGLNGTGVKIDEFNSASSYLTGSWSTRTPDGTLTYLNSTRQLSHADTRITAASWLWGVNGDATVDITVRVVTPQYERTQNYLGPLPGALGTGWVLGTVATKSAAYPASAALVANAGRKNLVQSPTMAGATVGDLDAGGTLPIGWYGWDEAGLTLSIEGTGQLSNGEYYIDLRLRGTNVSGAIAYVTTRYHLTQVVRASYQEYFTERVGYQLLAGSLTGLEGSGHGVGVELADRDSTGAKIAGTWNKEVPTGTLAYANHTRQAASANTAYVTGCWLYGVAIGATVECTIRLVSPQMERTQTYLGPLPGALGTDFVLGTVATRTANASAALAPAATVAASATRTAGATAALTASATVSASATRTRAVSSSLAVTGTVAATAGATRPCSIVLAAAGSSLAIGGGLRRRTLALFSSATLAVGRGAIRSSAAALAAPGTIAATATRMAAGAAEVTASATVAATAAMFANIFLRPDADVTDNGWTAHGTADLFGALNEMVASDADYIRSPNGPTGEECEIGIAGEAVMTPIVMQYRAKKEGNATTLTIRIMEGANERAMRQQALTDSYADYEEALSPAEVAAVTDWSAVSVRMSAA